jgi:hypothetical protein
MAAESFVRVTHDGGLVDEYPLPLPMLPTYREMNLIKKVTGLVIGDVLRGMGNDPDADLALAMYAIKRERPDFDVAEAQALFDLPFGAIEIHFGDDIDAEEGGSPEAPRPESRADEPEHEPSKESLES